LAVGFFTNATLLNTEKAERIIRLGIQQLNISIDGATKETFEAIRHGAKFETVVNNARAFTQKRRELGRSFPTLQIGMVLMQENMHELTDMVRLAANIGADGVYTMFVSALVPEKMCELDPVRTNQNLRQARRVAAELKINFNAPADLPEIVPVRVQTAPEPMPKTVVEAPVGSAQGHYCSYPWNQLVVWNDGNASPCCRIRDQVDGLPFGSVHTSEPEELWNSPGMVRLRERLNANNPPPDCINCPIRTLRMNA
jgi:radical SAM protein with 4Fe4S-binding SPASM domain